MLRGARRAPGHRALPARARRPGLALRRPRHQVIIWVARFIAAAPGSTLHVRAFAPAALPLLSLAVISAVVWRSWLFRMTAVPLAALGIVAAFNGPRYDVIVAPSGDLVAVRGMDGRLAVVGKHFNAFAAEQWLAADGDDRYPASARDPHPRCDRDGCIAALPGGRLLSVVTAPPAYEEDCVRAAILISAIPAPVHCPAQVFDEQKLDQTGAVGLIWNGARYSVATDRSVLEDRPWSPAPPSRPNERATTPAAERTPGADPADPSDP